MIVIRPTHKYTEIQATRAVQAAAWGAEDRDITPATSLHAWMHAGGILLGAFDGETMVGFSAGFPGKRDRKAVIWSHMTAVIPDYQGQGIGRQLKFAQREAALQQGFETIAWTYDPMRSKNAFFNIESLGGSCNTLHMEFYGDMTDALNIGLVSDRFEVHWDLKSKGVEARASGQYLPQTQPSEQFVLRKRGIEPDSTPPQAFEHTAYAVELPADIDSLRKQSTELTRNWYFALRAAVIPLFEAGYSITGVYQAADQPETFAYILGRDASWYLYILETADGSLYTGITTEIQRRVQEHNAGRGAKYTATRRPVRLLAAWETFGQSQALKLERRLKGYTRDRKLALIASRADFHGAKNITGTF